MSLTSDKMAVSGCHILWAEDNLVNQRLTVRLLENQGHSVVVAGDGNEALAALDKEIFDRILMDVQMPHLKGKQPLVVTFRSSP
jgi:CheY-like chemotaxis protein